jgi:hypothetical protein
MSYLQYSPVIGRLIRQDPPADLGKPTRPFIEGAVKNGQVEEAKQWLDYYLSEQTLVVNIYVVWNWYMVRYYLDHKPGSTLQECLEKSMAPWAGTTAGIKGMPVASVQTAGMNAVLTVEGFAHPIVLTEGDRRYDITLGSFAEQAQRQRDWREAVDRAIEAGKVAEFNRLLDARLPQAWLMHDLQADWSWALLTLFAKEWGEEILDEVLRVTEEPWVTTRYAKLKDMNQEQAFQLTIEGMRGHFTGPGRVGQIIVTDEPDRWVMSFDACGSGGRMRRGDPLVGSGSRLDAPYHFLMVEGAYDWTWNRTGVCAYCAHCAVVNQVLPIEGLGYPMRKTEYPENPNDPCRWIIYKDRNAFPDETYTAVGKNPPKR